MDPNLELYRSLLHLTSYERRDRMAHLPWSEFNRCMTIVDREGADQRLEESIAGRDLVQEALTNPSESIEDFHLKYTLLGRTIHRDDEDMMVARITNNIAESSPSLVDCITGFERYPQALGLDAWKLIYCDIYYVDGGNSTLQEIYETRLREEELQTPAARARELVRDDDFKIARRNAKWMIPAIERLSADEQAQWTRQDADLYRRLLEQDRDEEAAEQLSKQREYAETIERIWKQVSPAPPAWIQKILETRQQFSCVYYKSRNVYQTRYNWKSTWGRISNTCSPLRVSYASIHCQGYDNWISMRRLETEHWPIFSPNEDMAEGDDLRKHFKNYMEKNRSHTEEDEKKRKRKRKRKNTDIDDTLSPGLLRNTFIVIPIEFISGNLNIEESDFYDPCWVWAYDADWDSSEEETIVNSEKYQGRVKVAKWSVNSWFYAARWEGVSLRDMWLKAQQHPEKMWICYTKELEEWDHESYI